jgi:hypothetical protein
MSFMTNASTPDVKATFIAQRLFHSADAYVSGLIGFDEMGRRNRAAWDDAKAAGVDRAVMALVDPLRKVAR